jgi:hypothetical protein
MTNLLLGAGRHARPRFALTAALVVLVLTSWVVPAIAVELEPNQTYAGGTRVESSSVGVSFLTPEGWGGRLGPNPQQQVLLLGSDTIEGVGLAILQADVTAAQVMTRLSEAQDLGDGVVLRLTEPPATRGSLIATRYQNETYVGRALALLGPARNAVIFFFAGPPKNESAYVQLLGALGRSTSFLESATATAPTPAPVPAPSDLDPMWAELLTGQALNYFSSYNSGGGGGGTATRRILHLCPNGRFAYFGEGLTTMNVPGATGSSGGRDGFQGRWSLESPTQTTAMLVLTVDGGRQIRWPLRYVDKKTFLNGQRWFREPSNVCR